MNFGFETSGLQSPSQYEVLVAQEKEYFRCLEIRNEQGEKTCDIEIATERYGEGGVEQVTQLILVAPSGERIDFLEYLDITDRRILTGSRYRGEHSWFSDSEIRLPPIKNAIDIAILIHESNHARQARDSEVLQMARTHIKMSERRTDQLFPLSPSHIALLRDVHALLAVDGVAEDDLQTLGSLADQYMPLHESIETQSYEKIELTGIKLFAESALRAMFLELSESLPGGVDRLFSEQGIRCEAEGLVKFPNDNKLAPRFLPIQEEEGLAMLNAALPKLTGPFAFSIAQVEEVGDEYVFTAHILSDSRDTFLRMRVSISSAILDQRSDEAVKNFLLQYRGRSPECRKLEGTVKRAAMLAEEYAIAAAPHQEALLRMIKAPVIYLEVDATRGAIHQMHDLREQYGVDFLGSLEPTEGIQTVMKETIEGMRVEEHRIQQWQRRLNEGVNCVDYSLVALGTYGIDVTSIEALEKLPVARKATL